MCHGLDKRLALSDRSRVGELSRALEWRRESYPSSSALEGRGTISAPARARGEGQRAQGTTIKILLKYDYSSD